MLENGRAVRTARAFIAFAALAVLTAACAPVGEQTSDVLPPASTSTVTSPDVAETSPAQEPDGSSDATSEVLGDTTIAPSSSITQAAPVPSAGCAAGAQPPVPGWSMSSVSAGGVDRSDWYYIPEGYDGVTPIPLVLTLHGYGVSGRIHGQMTRMYERADQAGFLMFAPEGNPQLLSPLPYWNVNKDPDLLDDVGYIDALLDWIEVSYCYDVSRVYAVGFDMGAQMAAVLGCDLSDRIAAVAGGGGSFIPAQCNRGRPVPALLFHGTEDPVHLYEGGLGTGAGTTFEFDDHTREVMNAIDRPPVEDYAAWWAQSNGCSGEPSDEQLSTNIVDRTFGCEPGAEVRLLILNGAGHIWPPGLEERRLTVDLGPLIDEFGSPDLSVPPSFFINDEIWRFLTTYHLS